MRELIPVFMLLLGSISCVYSQGGDCSTSSVIINEFGNGSSGSQEFIELLVLAEENEYVDLNGYIIDDNNMAKTGCGNQSGHIRLGDCFSSIPRGSLILLYNPDDIHPKIDTSKDGMPNADQVYQLSIKSPCIHQFKSYPNYRNSNFLTTKPSTTNTWTSLIALNNRNDAVQVLNGSEVLQHAVVWGTNDYPKVNWTETINFPTRTLTGKGIGLVHKGEWEKESSYSIIKDEDSSPGLPNNQPNAEYIMEVKTFGVNAGIRKIDTTICSGDYYSFENISYASEGVHQHRLSTLGGCDSIIQLTLHLRDRIILSSDNVKLYPADTCDQNSKLVFSQMNGTYRADVYKQENLMETLLVADSGVIELDYKDFSPGLYQAEISLHDDSTESCSFIYEFIIPDCTSETVLRTEDCVFLHYENTTKMKYRDRDGNLLSETNYYEFCQAPTGEYPILIKGYVYDNVDRLVEIHSYHIFDDSNTLGFWDPCSIYADNTQLRQSTSYYDEYCKSNIVIEQNGSSLEVFVNGGYPGYTYTWDDGVVGKKREGLDKGRYCVVVTDSMCGFVRECIYIDHEYDVNIVKVCTDNNRMNVTVNISGIDDTDDKYSYKWKTGSGSTYSDTKNLENASNQDYVFYFLVDNVIRYEEKISKCNGLVEGSDTSQVVSRSFATGSELQDIYVYPNPAMNELNLKIPTSLSKEKIDYRLFGTMGDEILSGSVYGKQFYTVDVSNLAKGIYILNIVTNRTNSHSFRIIKQ